MAMMNSYYTILTTHDEDGPTNYGYTFRDRNMREARLHARDVAEEIGAFKAPKVWRISHAEHVKLYSPFRIPSPLSDL